MLSKYNLEPLPRPRGGWLAVTADVKIFHALRGLQVDIYVSDNGDVFDAIATGISRTLC